MQLAVTAPRRSWRKSSTGVVTPALSTTRRPLNSNTMFRNITVLSSSLLLANSVFAIASVNLEIRDTLPALSVQGSGLIEFQNSISIGSATAFGYSNLDTGILRASAVAPTGSLKYSFAEARFQDTVTFAPGSSGVAYLDWNFDGTLSPYAGDAQSTALFTVSVNGVQRNHVLTNASCIPIFATSCTEGTSIDQSGTFAFEIAGGGVSILVALSAYPGSGGTADFSNTGRTYLRTPEGVTYTSSSGTFLVNASPIAVVPEPSSYALLMVGLVGGIVLSRVKHTR